MRLRNLPLRVTAITLCLGALTALTAQPTAAAVDIDCSTILPVGDRLETQFNLVSPAGGPPWLAGQIRDALAPLRGLASQAAIDLRIRSDLLASTLDASDPYRPASPQQLASDLAAARQQLAASREYCAP
jgi:hypothetical protein